MEENDSEKLHLTQEWPRVSIIIPTRNEEADLYRCLSSIVDSVYPDQETIVVDDSSDRTPEIVSAFADRGVQLIDGPRRGRCEARNVGIQAASGQIVVILNADVSLPLDFLFRIVPHYRAGAGYVLVQSTVSNADKLIPRYIGARHRRAYDHSETIEWTEGFSCLRDAALAVGLFPTPPIPLMAGEDGYFGALLSRRYKKVIDRNIVVSHVAPTRWREFWKTRVERGMPAPLHYLGGEPLPLLIMHIAIRTIWRVIYVSMAAPALIGAVRISRFSPKGWRDALPFLVINAVESLALVAGGWKGLGPLVRADWDSRRKDRVN